MGKRSRFERLRATKLEAIQHTMAEIYAKAFTRTPVTGGELAYFKRINSILEAAERAQREAETAELKHKEETDVQ